MIKRIFIYALCLSLVLSCGGFKVLAQDNSVTAINGSVNINWYTEADEGSQVTIFILPAIKAEGADVTLERVRDANTVIEITGLDIEYATTLTAQADGLISHNCEMSSDLSTGEVHVVYNHLGLDPAWQILGTFDHVGETDIENLVNAFNGCTSASGYEGVIKDDIEGNNVLKASFAYVDYYSEMISNPETAAERKSEFYNLLFGFKPTTGFDISSLIEKFNESVVWMKLRTESDTEAVLSQYNGTGIGKYWNVDIGLNSDYSTLTNEEKSEILSQIKGAKYSSKALLESGFDTNVVLAFFRQVSTTDELKNLIAADNAKYSSYFTEVRNIVSNARLDAVKCEVLYSNVLAGNSSCQSFAAIEQLFRNSIPSSGGGGGGGGGSDSYQKPIEPSTNKYEGSRDFLEVIPQKTMSGFKDVADNHWASHFVERLYTIGAINGVGDDNFAPENLIARQDFIKIFIGALNIEISETKSEFTDIADDAYYTKYVMTAYKNGLINGIGENNFGVGQNMRREDVALIVHRLIESYGITAEDKVVAYNDGADISPYAIDAVKKVSSAGIFGGDNLGNFNPKDYLTRAETCAIICRLVDFVKEV